MYRIRRDGQGYDVERVPPKLLEKVAEAVETEGLGSGAGAEADEGGGSGWGAGAFV